MEAYRISACPDPTIHDVASEKINDAKKVRKIKKNNMKPKTKYALLFITSLIFIIPLFYSYGLLYMYWNKMNAAEDLATLVAVILSSIIWGAITSYVGETFIKC